MQSLLGFIYGQAPKVDSNIVIDNVATPKDDTTADTPIADDFETLNWPDSGRPESGTESECLSVDKQSVPVHYDSINQIHRKIKLLNEFKDYIENADRTTIYFNYIKNTIICEHDPSTKVNMDTYLVLPALFGGLYEYRTTDSDDIFRTLLLMEL